MKAEMEKQKYSLNLEEKLRSKSEKNISPNRLPNFMQKKANRIKIPVPTLIKTKD